MKYYVDNNTVCPFYCQQEPLRLHCDGFSEGNKIHLQFDCKVTLKAHKSRYCNNIASYKNCPLYRLIDKHYQEVQKDEDK